MARPPTQAPAPLVEATARVAAARTREDVARALAKDAARATGAQCGALLTVDDAGALHLVAQMGLPADVATAWQHIDPDAPSLLAEAARTGELDVIEGGLGAFDPSFGSIERAGLRSLVVVPLAALGRPLGVLVFAFARRATIDRDEESALVALARVGAQALERARLSQAEEKARRSFEEAMRQSSILVELTAALSRAPTIDEMAAVVVEHAAAALPVQAVSLWRVEDDGKTLRLLSAVGAPPVAVDGGRAIVDGSSPLAHCVSSGEPVWISSRREAERRWYGLLPDGTDDLAIAALPLVVEGRAIGALWFTLKQACLFPPHERGFYLVFARHVAQAIDRARLLDEATLAVRVRDEFLSVASHELKTPVTSLQIQVESVLRRLHADLRPQEIAARLTAAQSQIARLTKLVDDLLDVSRIQAGRVDLEREPMDLAALAHDVARRFEHEAKVAGCSIEVVADVAVVGDWDRTRIDQVLTNMVSNAIKYGGGAPVRVAVDADERAARARVEDHGIGIAPEDFARVFGRFERLVSARNFGGFGLGLWISRRIVEDHGGHISFTSQLSKGSTFVVTLPLSPVATAQ